MSSNSQEGAGAELVGRLRPLASRWGQLWGLPDLGGSIAVEFSSRLTRSLALCRPVEGRIRLAARLKSGNEALLEEVFCHELAHIAVHRLHGPNARPHGPEWRDLVAQAGYEPRTKAPPLGPPRHARARQRRARWEHRCPVCQTVRIGGRPVPEWKCRECREAGLSGDMVITRLPEKSGAQETDAHRENERHSFDSNPEGRSL